MKDLQEEFISQRCPKQGPEVTPLKSERPQQNGIDLSVSDEMYF